MVIGLNLRGRWCVMVCSLHSRAEYAPTATPVRRGRSSSTPGTQQGRGAANPLRTGSVWKTLALHQAYPAFGERTQSDCAGEARIAELR